jgi:hypothetical protein
VLESAEQEVVWPQAWRGEVEKASGRLEEEEAAAC